MGNEPIMTLEQKETHITLYAFEERLEKLEEGTGFLKRKVDEEISILKEMIQRAEKRYWDCRRQSMQQLVCPECGNGNELRVIEDVRIERNLGDVTTMTTEYLDVVKDSEDHYREVGVECRNCHWSCGGGNWKQQLKGVVVK